MSIFTLLIQVAVSLLAVVLYHLWVSRRRQPAPGPAVVVAPLAPGAAPPGTSPPAQPMAPEMLAVITAAIAVALGQPHRVVSVQPGAARAAEVNVWAMEGRMEQFQSHRIR